MSSKASSATRPHSSLVLDGESRAPSRAMLYAVGYKESDFAKSQIGVASTWSMVTPCNMHIDQLAREAMLGINQSGGKARNRGVLIGGVERHLIHQEKN